MRVIKPLRLGVLSRPYRWQGEYRLGVSILALSSMGAHPQLRPEPELWELAGAELAASDRIVDLAYSKHYPEFLATGYAYTLSQKDATQCEVSVQVEALRKTLIVSGERHWLEPGDAGAQERRHSPAQPFERIRLDWSTAYGGPACPDNPHGIGAPAEGKPAALLPHVEMPHDRITAPDQTIAAAGFGPLGLQWPRRMRLAGECHDAAWLQQHFPGFATDFDPRFFNMAAEGQVWLDRTAIPPGASYAIQNMHPAHRRLEGRLPAWQARCFINRQSGPDEVFEEIAMRHTTVWFFPHLEQMILVYHGTAAITEDDAHDVRSLMPALEPAAAARPPAHYRKVWLQREDRQTGALHAFEEHDLLPGDAIGPWIDTESPAAQASALQTHMAGRRQRIEEENRRHLAGHGANVIDLNTTADDALPIEPVRLADLPAYAKTLEARAAQAKHDAETQLRDRGHDPECFAATAARASGPENLHRMREQLRHQAGAHPDQVTPEQLEASEQALHDMYLHALESQAIPPRLDAETMNGLRREIEARLAGERNFDGMDLTGADLSGLDLRRASFRRTLFENANLRNCRFDGSDLREAVLARTELVDASLRDTRLDQATLFRSDCSRADFSRATLIGTRLGEALLDNSRFAGSRLENLTLNKTFLLQCDFSHAKLGQLVFDETLLRRCTFNESWLHKTLFNHCVLDKIDFTSAQISRCSWVQCRIGADFAQSRIQLSAFTSNTVFEGASFGNADLHKCNFRASTLDGCSFARARLDGCDFSEASLREADLSVANASQSNFTRSDLSAASLQHAKLIGATLKQAKLNASDFRGANLFRADIAQTETDDATCWEGAYTTQMKTVPTLRRMAS
ncbi:DUF2169 family type VI secretion system accessory protein [Paraburkholderia lycopersici]|uniref:Uncharacterized protein YjbI, contains pentapeptide repeats n=1 Tax=Paraburkholderia lycopersici TaxID=416944 RepID=A0A1G6XVC1_9BURK|nr:DUF2169 domain-containing protein [Paraburkholderia lycopersici]SDD81365.1 Uncharacterized protein YjbI, contains pentapeptide repeats [Paraburkholderia lycopersici]